MLESHQLVCISCPMGCRLTLEKDESPIGYSVTGNNCKRGVEYAITEMTNPTRMVTSTVVIEGACLSRLPVRTNRPIPKGRIMDCMELINGLTVISPVHIGQVLIKDLFGTGVNLIASRSL